jgi:hypothetical protein
MPLHGVLLLLLFSWFLNETVLFVSSSPMHQQQQLYKLLNETFLLLGRPLSSYSLLSVLSDLSVNKFYSLRQKENTTIASQEVKQFLKFNQIYTKNLSLNRSSIKYIT